MFLLATKPDHQPLEAATLSIDAAVLAGASSPVAARIRGLLTGYNVCWQSSSWRVLHGPFHFHGPLVNPRSGGRSKTFDLVGQFDGLVEQSGRRYVVRCKSTSDEIASHDSPFWQRLAVDAQASGWALQQCPFGPIDGILFDAVRRIELRPKAIPSGKGKRTNADICGTLAEIETSGTYCGQPISAAARVRAPELEREDDGLFRLRVAADALARPEAYFQRRLIRFDADQVRRSAEETWQAADELRVARRTGHHFRNGAACVSCGMTCEYLGLCAGSETLDPARWRRRPSHSDSAASPTGERTLLSQSRLQCFKQCRRRHFYRYELGLERTDTLPGDAWSFGSLMSTALRAWWKAQAELRQQELTDTTDLQAP